MIEEAIQSMSRYYTADEERREIAVLASVKHVAYGCYAKLWLFDMRFADPLRFKCKRDALVYMRQVFKDRDIGTYERELCL